MEPKTSIQKKVVALSSKLPPVTEKQKKHAFDSCLESYVVISREKLFCMECGHSWKEVNASILLVKIDKGCTCPNCNNKLVLKENHCRILRDSAYYSIITTHADMQVIRMFFVAKDMKKGLKADTWISEVMQHWIDVSGKVTTMSKQVQGLSRYYDQWIFQSNLEVRLKSYKSSLRYDIGAFKTYPERRILTTIKRNGFSGHFYGFKPHSFFSELLGSPQVETLLKTKQIELMRHYIKYGSKLILKHWPSIRICIRNGYKVKDPSVWLDYLDLLEFFGRDLYNPKYICPENLKLAHDRLVNKKREIDRKKKLADMRKQLDAEQVKYAKQKGKFFGLLFRSGNISVKTLESVEEVMIEGDKLNHCVFANSYHQKPESLLMSARINDEPVETIEISINKLQVMQSRGSNNKHTQYHSKILDLVNSNINKIEQRI